MILRRLGLLARQAAHGASPSPELAALAARGSGAASTHTADTAAGSCGASRSISTSGGCSAPGPQHIDREQVEQQLSSLRAVKRKVLAMGAQNETKKAIKYYKPHQWWYLNPQYYADNPSHTTRVPPYASHQCKLRPSQAPRGAAAGFTAIPTGKNYQQMKASLVARSKNGDRNRARRAFNKMWTVRRLPRSCVCGRWKRRQAQLPAQKRPTGPRQACRSR
jgi:hypothetical protein